jgi:hypothetical protein
MTKNGALYDFFSSFGIPAYEENAVYDLEAPPSFPYLTYQGITDSFGNTVMLNVSLWYRSTSWADCNAMTETISQTIGNGGKILPYDDGAILVKRTTPFAQNMSDPSDDMIKRKFISLNVEFLSEN